MKNCIRIIVLSFLFPLASCVFNDDDDSNPASYLFVENFIETSGVLISGPEVPLLQIDFPTYRYDEDTGTLKGIFDFEVDKDLKVIYGSGTCLSGTAGGGCASGLTGIYEIPYERGTFELLKIEEDGTIVFIYEDEVFSLSVDDVFTYSETYLDSSDMDGVTSISEITSTYSISNFGFISKEDIELWEW